jgi:hypothetical protein
MAGIFKSLDKSDVRITPFHTHKLWSDNLGYSYSTGNSTLTRLPSFLTSLENVNYRNYVYTIETGSNQRIKKIDITDDYTVLASSNISGISRGIQAIEVPPIGLADVIILGGIGTNNDIVINFISGSDLSTIDSNRVDSTNNPQTLYQIATGWDYVASNATASVFACTSTGLYSRKIASNTLKPIGGGVWQRHNHPSNGGTYLAATPYVPSSGQSLILGALVRSGLGIVVMATHDMLTANQPMSWNYYQEGVSSIYETDTGATIKRFLLTNKNNSGVLWTLFDNGNLWVCDINGTNMKRVATNVIDIQTDYDSLYNPNYVTQQTPNNTTTTRKIYIVDEIGIVFVDANYEGNELVYEKAVDCRQYFNPQKTITKTFITKNTDTPILGMYVNGGVQQSTLFTMNTKTYELSDPVFVGTLKNNVIFEADNKTDGIYAMRSYNGNFEYTSMNHWYKFTI